MAVKKKTFSFEAGLEHLQEIAEAMEKSELPLDQLLSLYEEGLKLSGELTRKLEAAEGRMMEVRAAQNGEMQLMPTDMAAQDGQIEEQQ